MRNVFLGGRLGNPPTHSLYQEILRYPPEGFKYVTSGYPSGSPTLFNLDQKVVSSHLLAPLWYEVKGLVYSAAEWTTRSKKSGELIFATQQLVFSGQPWITDFEFANALVGYGDIRPCRRFVRNALASKHCKKIMPWSDWAKRTLYSSLDCRLFGEKVETVRLAVRAKSFTKTGSERVRLLFVGSTNPLNFQNFELKGG